MIVTFKPDQEQVVGEAIRAGLIENADEIVDVGIEVIRQRLETDSSSNRNTVPQEKIDAAAERLLKFGHKYRFGLGGLSLRELVNEGRR